MASTFDRIAYPTCPLDEDLAAMYLSDKKAGIPRQLADHEELEVLLESFSKQVEEIVNESETTKVSLFQLDLQIYSFFVHYSTTFSRPKRS